MDQLNDWDKDKLFENFKKFLSEKNIQPQGPTVSPFSEIKKDEIDKKDQPQVQQEALTDDYIKPEIKEEPKNNVIENKPITNIDAIPIKANNIDFNKLVELEMQKGQYQGNDNEYKPKFEYKPRPKYTDKYKISEPTETKKYKYYSDNFKSKKKKNNDNTNESNKYSQNNNNFVEPTPESVNTQQNFGKKNKRVAPTVPVNKMNKFVSKEKKPINSSSNNNNFQRNYQKNSSINKKEELNAFTKHENVKNSPPRQSTYPVDNIWGDYINKSTTGSNSTVNKNASKTFMNKNKEINKIDSNYLENLSFEEIEALAEDPSNIKDISKNIKEYKQSKPEKEKKEQICKEQIPPEELYLNEDKEIYNIIEDKLLQKETISRLNPQPIQQKTNLINNIGGSKKIVEKKKILNQNIPSQFKNLLRGENSNNDEDLSQEEDGHDLISLKIFELNKQIENVKKENEKVSGLKKEYEILTNKLKSDIEEYSQKKEFEKAEFEKYKAAELKKIERERKNQLKSTKNMHNIQNKKEREEIEALKEQISKLQEEMKIKEQRNKLTIDKLKKQLDEMNKKNEALQNEIKQYEEMRIKNLNSKPSGNLLTTKNTTPKQNGNINLKATKSLKNLSYKNNNANNNPINTSNIENINNANQIRTSNDTISSYTTSNNFSKQKNNLGNNTNGFKRNSSTNLKQTSQIKQNTNNSSLLQNNKQGEQRQEIKVNIKNHSHLKNKIETNCKEEKYDVDNMNEEIQNSNNGVKQFSPSDDNNSMVKSNRESENEENEADKFNMIFLPQYHDTTSIEQNKVVRQDVTEDGKIIKVYQSNKKEVFFPSGLRKEIFPDGYLVSYFNNKDIKQIYPDGREVYFFAENKTVQTKLPNGMEVYKFANGQLEKNFPDGTRIVNYPDGTVRYLYPDGNEEIFFNDGSLQKKDPNGIITIQYQDGIKDTIYPNGQTKREYLDGTVDLKNTNDEY